MKLTILLLTTVILQVSANSFAQKISLSEKNAKLTKIFDKIRLQTGYDFMVTKSVLKNAKPVNIDVKDEEFLEVLKMVFAGQNLTYSFSNNAIIVSKKPFSVGFPETIIKALINVTGKVLDERGIGLPGATIKVKGTTRATITDSNGRFSIKGIDENAILVITYLGYDPKEIKADATAEMIITLTPQNSALSEIVVVAYGTQKRTSLTGAIATITPKQLKDRPVTSIQNALQGVSPGLTILQRPSDVSRNAVASTAVSIRGRGSLVTTAGTGSPMYVIDGIPASAQEFATLNPSDVSSMSVLKDASSAALYGSRAANGVIMVTTKRGSGDKTTVELNANYGWQSPTRISKYVGSVDYTTLYNEALKNAGAAALFTDQQIQWYKDGSKPDLYPNTNWYNEVLRKNAPLSDVNLNINAPGKITNSYLGLSYLNQESIIPHKSQDRIVAKLNTETTIVPEILKIGTNFSFINQSFDRKGDLSWTELNRSLPTAVLRQSNGEWGSIDNGKANSQTAGRNQLRWIEESSKAWDRDNYLQTAANATLTPIKGLSINGLVSLKYTNGNSWTFNNTLNPINDFLTGKPMNSTQRLLNDMLEYWRKRKELLVQGTADYERNFGKHYGKITVGASQESNTYRTAFVGRKNFPNNEMTTVVSGSSNPEDINSDTDGQANRSNQEEWAMRSVFGRFNYAFDDKYLFEVNTRVDYSSRFRKDVREAMFPSFSAGWNVTKEDFMKNVGWIDNLKLRGSYGSLGNQEVVLIGNYFDRLNTGYQYSFEEAPQGGVWADKISNPITGWEKVYMTDLGIDLGLFKGKLDITADYYIKDTKELLMRVPALATIGVNTSTTDAVNSGLPLSNGAATRNKGFELAVTHNNKIGNDFTFSIGGNLSIISSKITKLGGGDEVVDGRYIQKIGESIGSFYGYESEGLFVDAADVTSHAFQTLTTKPGDIKFKDLNGDNKINSADRKVIGNDVPWLNYGFNLNAAYKGFDLSVLTYGVAKVKTYLSEEASYPFFNGANVKEQWLNRWTVANPNPNADFPRILTTAAGAHNYNPTSSFWLFSGAYFRVRGITLGYTIPQDVSKRIGLSKLRVYGAANNPFTIMADKRLADYDPESGSGRGGYPGMKTWSMGLSAGF
ncbi:TonB-dependent receptor [Pedobacter nyackensis]|uniref:TonB-linked outer membrane protein, SusC/RagA family n=1 Tax=Pedobacter nyackensis TaxID=475255 RepID=A0A1W2F5C6_9SPHI|nr:TonB-dependent receptor [Pedobacter nyackensis]SMD17022.1 TonB-linked outer membrane protein, SusC/RagA family [Pedobacter nyackensis]